VANFLKGENHDLKEDDLQLVASKSAGYSGADLRVVCQDAALEPIRSLHLSVQFADCEDVSVPDL